MASYMVSACVGSNGRKIYFHSVQAGETFTAAQHCWMQPITFTTNAARSSPRMTAPDPPAPPVMSGKESSERATRRVCSSNLGEPRIKERNNQNKDHEGSKWIIKEWPGTFLNIHHLFMWFYAGICRPYKPNRGGEPGSGFGPGKECEKSIDSLMMLVAFGTCHIPIIPNISKFCLLVGPSAWIPLDLTHFESFWHQFSGLWEPNTVTICNHHLPSVTRKL